MRELPPNIHMREHGGKPPPMGIFLIPALVALPLVRWPLGYETAQPARAFLIRIVVVGVAFLVSRFIPQAQPGWELLAAYVALSFVVVCVMFTQRAIGQRHGEEIHTTEAGWSYLAWRSQWPVWACEQVIVPLGVAAAGYVVAQSVSWELGWWLVLTGASLAILARWESAKRWALTRTTVDTMLQAQMFGHRVEQHEQRAYNPAAGRPGGGNTAQPGNANSSSGAGGEPDVAELGGSRRGAEPPFAASWKPGDGIGPASMTWLGRKGRGGSGPGAGG